ncbi:antigen 5 like allergen Cul n 1 [Drosophila elegans]|uniref:antigen 5 like allergen Cul n 1 n=1 Tax=Drosophila elegans TaxID=30023 RepID=UPI0007E63A25|nr:antigen 5 like allergen Cul n 1 [Drosophila elegans]
MLLLWFLLLVIGIECAIVYRTRWPKYMQKKHYNPPIKPLDYCNGNLCPGNLKHITCGVRFWGPKCGKSHTGIMLTNQRNEILRALNDFRKKVVRGEVFNLPKAEQLPDISWDEELSVIAMRVSNQCSDHSISPCVNTFRYKNVGESSDFVLLSESSKEFSALKFFLMWFKYHNDFPEDYVSSFPKLAQSDHLTVFANLIYEKNRKMGCGMLKSGRKYFLTCLFNKKIQPDTPVYKTNNTYLMRSKKIRNKAIFKTVKKNVSVLKK